MEQPRASLLVKLPPPIIYAATFVAGMVVDWLMPWTPDWTQIKILHWLGWALTVAGLLSAPAGAGFFALRRTTLNPAGMPARLVTSGPFALSRNPMYVGLTLIYLGVALVLAKIWPLVLVVLPWAVMNWVVIPFEETRLRNIFGQTYVDYCRRVRRWI
jgi:protein-S-isoprenylcysteine O-methyltransferase Ste14